MLFTGIPVCMFVNINGLAITATQPVQIFSNISRVQRAWASDILCYIQNMLFTGIPVCLFVNIKGLSITATQPVQIFSNIIRVQHALSNLRLIDLLCSIK
jgi:hypothetical protein